MVIEVVRPPTRLSHFSIKEGSAFLRDRLRERVQSPQPEPSAAEAQLRRDMGQLETADRFIDHVIATAFPKKKNVADLLNETKLLAPDAERALSVIDANGNIDERLKFEMVRKMLLAGITGEIDQRSLTYNLRSELHDVHSLLDQRFFKGKIGETHHTTTYSVHKRSTNEVIGVYDRYPWFIKPGYKVKKFTQQMREVEDVGYVLSSVREKTREASILKTLRRAVQVREEKGTDELDALKAVKDAMGLMFVVKGTMGSNEPRVNHLKEKVLALLKEKYGEVMVIPDNVNGAGEYATQKTQANYQRIQVKVESLPIPLELIFYGEGDYINDTYNIGKRDRRTKLYSGNAHKLFEIDRVRQILPVIYPEKVGDKPMPGFEGLSDETFRTMKDAARTLKREYNVKFWRIVPEKFISNYRNRKSKKIEPKGVH